MPRIKQKTVVWTANRDNLTLPSDAALIFNTDGRLIVQLNQSQQIPVSNVNQSASSASMLDSGNFVLYDSESKIIWQTFASPTDTIVEGQPLLADRRLVSSISETNHSRGIFELIMQDDGNLVMYPTDLSPRISAYAYWSTFTSLAGNNVSLHLDADGQLYMLNSTGFVIKTLRNRGTVSGNSIHRATVDADGIFRLYSHNLDQNSDWSIEWKAPENICDPIGFCGLNSYCTIINQGSECACLPGFDFIDRGQKNLGCRRNSTLDDCISFEKSNFTMHELDNLSWEDGPYSTLASSTSIQCRDWCLEDCYCEAAIYNNKECRKQKLPLRFGRFRQDGQITTFVKVSIGESGGEDRRLEPPPTSTKNRNKLQIGILVGGVICLALGLIGLAISSILTLRYRVSPYRELSDGGLVLDAALRSFTYQELVIATNGFSEKLGRGAFGTVFKGALLRGQTRIAVKKLEKVMADGEVEFQNEIRSIGRTHHKNLVHLLGYCHDKSNILLVYEFMKNGSLADFLFNSAEKLSWGDRTGIALDIARGIQYLHEECETQIIHCDINPKNILMDENWHAKISDFGLAKLLMPDQSKTVTGIRGTRGYVAPEWYKNQAVTTKADVYSFGIVFLEIICCRRSVSMDVPGNEAILVEWVYSCFEENELHKLVNGEEVDAETLKMMVSVGLWCIQDEPSFRPSMKKVVLMLEGLAEIPIPPISNSFSNVLVS
ncbi:G-type lectin S-receptor-like serine/threonine-protein kinase LECRK4 [Mercurialis annua]|uniref:G-type lectin S-receptor-like serine/threonine-protein kinase LECRK4 n=1 Tax=Mercurialis annua TaxID=3986 RepID=UPI002160086B|nr:G-type lectin S-receptor-like serine/threonine-protein kinase LECRK4 [Mercurialis annua]